MKRSSGGFDYIKIEHLTVKDGGKSIIEDINLRIDCGELTVVIGPNGAGKSTLFKALTGALKYSGTVRYMDLTGNPVKGIRIGYVPQFLKISRDLPVSVLDLYLSGITKRPSFLKGSQQKRETVEEMLVSLDAGHLIDSGVSDLSGGELQRVLLGFALAGHPDVLLLDEPISGADKMGEDRFFEILSSLKSKAGLTVIMITHDLKRVLAYADKAVLLNRTVLASGRPENVFHDKRFVGLFGRISGK